MSRIAVHAPAPHAGCHTLHVAVEVPDLMLANIDAHSDILDEVVELTRTAIRDHAARAILDQVAAAHLIPVDDIVGIGRTRRVVEARHATMAALLDAGFSSPQAGQVLDRDHTTVLAGARAHRRRQEQPANATCERCDRPSLGGGRWCDRHFRDEVAARKGAA
jgi:hypothetical protein